MATLGVCQEVAGEETMSPAACLLSGQELLPAGSTIIPNGNWTRFVARLATGASPIAARFEPMPHARAGCDHHMKTGATAAAFARRVRLRPVDRRSTPCPSPIAPRTSSLAVQTQRRKLRRTRPERSAWPEPEPTSSGPWQPQEPMLPDDRDFGPAMARLAHSS